MAKEQDIQAKESEKEELSDGHDFIFSANKQQIKLLAVNYSLLFKPLNP